MKSVLGAVVLVAVLVTVFQVEESSASSGLGFQTLMNPKADSCVSSLFHFHSWNIFCHRHLPPCCLKYYFNFLILIVILCRMVHAFRLTEMTRRSVHVHRAVLSAAEIRTTIVVAVLLPQLVLTLQHAAHLQVGQRVKCKWAFSSLRPLFDKEQVEGANWIRRFSKMDYLFD